MLQNGLCYILVLPWVPEEFLTLGGLILIETRTTSKTAQEKNSVTHLVIDQFLQRFIFHMRLKDINRQDKSGKTPLHTAILSNQFRIVSKLLESGADVTISDDAGDTVLHTAIRVGSERLVLVSIHKTGLCTVC